MSLTPDQRAEKVASKLFSMLEQVSSFDDSFRDRVYTRVIEKLESNGQTITAQGVRALRTCSLEIL